MELFISYSRDDKHWVYELARELKEKLELAIWIDTSLAMGQHWWDEILKNIEECDYFMLILTPAYVTSPYCIRELEYAYDINKPILPLYMKPCELPDIIKSVQYYNIEGQSLPDVLNKCSRALLKAQKDSLLKKERSAPVRKVTRPSLPELEVTPDVVPIVVDDSSYRTWLRERTDTIDIRGIGVGYTREAHRLSLRSLYMPLHACSSRSYPQRIPLEERIRMQPYTLVLGLPGSGKTTFLNYLALMWVDLPKAFPLLMRAIDIYEYINVSTDKYHPDLASTWIIDYWMKQSVQFNWGFERTWLQEQFQSGNVSFLLDGLDELSSHEARVKLTQIVDSSLQRWPNCRWVMTSRPNVLRDKAIPLDFAETTIDSLGDNEIKSFIHRWVNLLFEREPLSAGGSVSQAYERELLTAIRDRPDINHLARNPVMLTSMVVVHWNEKKLPEGKGDLYEAIIRWLLKARDAHPSPYAKPKVRKYLQVLALAMFCHPNGRRTTVGRHWAAQQLMAYFDGTTEQDKIEQALYFLDYAEIETGIIVRRDEGNIMFWHASFLEYLVASEIASRSDEESGWWSIIQPVLFNHVWKEVIRFVPVILHRLGDERVDLFIKRVLCSRASDSLIDIARIVGFLGVILLDLSVNDYSVEAVEEYVWARDQVMQIFTLEGAAQLDFQIRYNAAIALGRGGDGDPRFFKPEENWIAIPGGTAFIGAQKNNPAEPNYDDLAEEAEQPVHQVYSAAFQIGRYPVTVQEYRRFLEDGSYHNKGYQNDVPTKISPPRWDEQLIKPNCPVVYVNWSEACAYCEWLSQRDNLWNYRLPTESEWEYMARIDQVSYTRYMLGNISPIEVANELIGNRDQVAPVGLFPRDRSARGVMDVNGNIHEWVYDPGPSLYSTKPAQASFLNERAEDSSTFIYRYRRGGSWDDTARKHRTASRTCVLPSNRYDDTGFRVLRVRKSIKIEGKSLAFHYPFTIYDVYSRHMHQAYSFEDANRYVQNYCTHFDNSLQADVIITSLFPTIGKKRPFARRPSVLGDAPLSKLDSTLLYQDTRIKLAIEEKWGASATLAQCQQDAHNVMEVLAVLLSTQGIYRPNLWQDLTDNDLDSLLCQVLNHYDAQRNQRLLEIGHQANALALQSLGPEINTLTLSQLLAYQVFADTVWQNQQYTTRKISWPIVGNFEIDDREQFAQSVLQDNRHMVFLFGDNGELVWDLFLLQFLLRHNNNLRITGVISNQIVYNNVNLDTFSLLLKNQIFREIDSSSRFDVLREESFRSSIDPNYCSYNLLETIRSCDFAFIKGGAGFESIQELPVDTYYAFVTHSDDSLKITGCKKGSGVFVRIPAHKAGYHYERQTLRDMYHKTVRSTN